LGYFSYFRDYIPRFSESAKPLTDLTGKGVSNRVPWGQREQRAFVELNNKLCQAANDSLQIKNFQKPLSIVDYSIYLLSHIFNLLFVTSLSEVGQSYTSL